MKTLHIIFSIALFVGLGCDATFIREVDIEDQAFEPQLYVSTYYVLGDNTIRVEAAPIISANDDFYKSEQGWVYEYDQNGNKIDSFYTSIQGPTHTVPYDFSIYDESGQEIYFNGCIEGCYWADFQIDPNLIKPNQKYTISVSSKDFPTVTGEAIIYDGPEFSLKSINSSNGSQATISFEIEDDPNHDNYYSIRGYYGECFETGQCYKNDIYLDYGLDQIAEIQFGYRRDYLADDVFVNNKKIVRYMTETYFLNNGSDTTTVEFELYNFSKKDFDYDIRLNGIYQSEVNPFVEPASVISNVKGGLGNFYLVGRRTITITEEEFRDLIEN